MKILHKLFETGKAKEKTFMNDRRQFKRYDLLLKLVYSDPEASSQSESMTKDISKAGLRFPVSAKLRKGALLDLRIEDPNSDKLLASKAKVVWSDEFGDSDDAQGARYEVGVQLLNKRLY
ncbi:MAG: PilZ domain-containing protein [Candidatus Omnitrophota bacterium]